MPRRSLIFLPPGLASPEGVVGVGGRPDRETLKTAYSQGIFPWPHEGTPLLWFSPDPRFALRPEEAHVSRSLRKEMRRGAFEVRMDTAFREVMSRCSVKPRPGQDGTWITGEMIEGYTGLHEEGIAHSIEAWRDGCLVGGLYGLAIGAVFFGESMFADAPNASKVAFATLLAHLIRWRFALLDCQAYTGHLASFGATEWPRFHFLTLLKRAVREPGRSGPWEPELSLAEAAEVFGGSGVS